LNPDSAVAIDRKRKAQPFRSSEVDGPNEFNVQCSMFKACPELVERVQGADGSLNVEPVTLNRA
jgi:hypothetical protein